MARPRCSPKPARRLGAAIARATGCERVAVTGPEQLASALEQALAEQARPVVVDVSVTRDPARMLPVADARTTQVKRRDRVA